MATCTLADCPGNLMTPPQSHAIGDNECGYLNAAPNPPRAKNAAHPRACRRPNCAAEFATPEMRLKHETDPLSPNHRKPGTMDFICDWQSHTDAIQDHDFCPVCQ